MKDLLNSIKECKRARDLLIESRDVLENYTYICEHGDGSQTNNKDVLDICRKIDSYLDDREET